ncbi:MAG: MFS transporter [Spirochaetes bacterium]|nr:MFS transporter [Spirochaetota bacterium]
MKRYSTVKITLLLTSMMTVMAVAIVSPSLPQMNQIFTNVPYADLLTRLIITLPALFIAAASPVFGYLIDNTSGKKLLLLSLVLYALGGASGFFLNDLYSILSGRIFLGIAVGGIMTISNSFIYDFFRDDERSAFVGYQNAFAGLGGVLFLALAGVLSEIQWHLPFLIYLFSIPVIFMVSAFFKEPKHEPGQKKEQKKNNNTAVPAFSGNLVILIYLLIFAGTAFFFMMPVQMPYLYNKLGVSNSLMGFAMSISIFATSVFAFLFKHFKKRLSFPRIYIAAFAFMAVGYTGISYSNGFLSLIIAHITASIGIGFLLPAGNLWIMETSPVEIRGRLIGRASMANYLGMFLSPILAQPIVSLYSVSAAFRVASIIMLIIIIGFIFSIRNLDYIKERYFAYEQ